VVVIEDTTLDRENDLAQTAKNAEDELTEYLYSMKEKCTALKELNVGLHYFRARQIASDISRIAGDIEDQVQSIRNAFWEAASYNGTISRGEE